MRKRVFVGLTGAALGLVGFQASAHHGWGGPAAGAVRAHGQAANGRQPCRRPRLDADRRRQRPSVGYHVGAGRAHRARGTEARRDSDGRDRDGQRASQQRHEALRGQDRARHAQRQELRRLSGPNLLAVRSRLALGSAARVARGLGPRRSSCARPASGATASSISSTSSGLRRCSARCSRSTCACSGAGAACRSRRSRRRR